MSFYLDKKEFDKVIQDKNYDWIWSTYKALQKEIKNFRLALQEIRQVEIAADYSCWNDKHDLNNPCCIAYRALMQ